LDYPLGEIQTIEVSAPSKRKTIRERTVKGKVLQVLLVPAAALDIVTSPIQLVYGIHYYIELVDGICPNY